MRVTTAYKLSNGKETMVFNSAKEADRFLGVSQGAISSCFREGYKCKGYTIERIGSVGGHGDSKSRLYKIWAAMHERCYNKHKDHYSYYGGRGIKVCEEWRGDNGYTNFRDWALSNGYSDNLTIDRIDNDENYEPSNCRWVTQAEQKGNTRRNRVIVYRGEKYTLAQLARVVGIKANTLRGRLELGWSVDDAVNKPLRISGRWGSN